jgi:hypothetical protein
VAVGHRAAEVAVGRQAVGVVDPMAGEVLAGLQLEAAVHEGEVAGLRVVGAVDPTAEVGVAPTAAAVGPTRAALRGEVVVGVVAEEALRGRRWCPG